ncbi:MAG: trypsin-like peptidase domain-containing protein [Chloroflexota bacterium]
MSRLVLRLTVLFLMSLSGTLSPTQAQETLEGIDLDRVERATVFITQTRTVNNRPVITCVGSGTLISRDGLIVTNTHNTVSNNDCPGDQLIVSLSISSDQPPVPSYYAEVSQANTGLDLALLRITTELNGRAVNRNALSLPFVDLADSSQVSLDETITIVGYPGIGNDPVGVLRGTITGFVAEPIGGNRSWMKTDTPIPGTMTGGGVYDSNGRLIAVPTTVPVIPLVADATCRLLEDTNGDGLVNAGDRCVPTGGFINALRPSNFVRPLLRGASLGLSVETVTPSSFDFDTSGDPTFSRLIISPSVANGMPTTIAQSLPTGTTSLYLFFDYRNMTPETIYELRVTINERPSPTFSLAPVRWSGGRNGLWYIGSSGQVWPNGRYEFTLFINGIASGSLRIDIGTPTLDTPTFLNIAFGIEDQGQLYGRNNVLPAGAVANARFLHRNIPEGTEWTAVWYYQGQVLNTITDVWQDTGQDERTIRIANAGGDTPLPPGQYRLELYIEDRLSTMADFTIAGAQDGAFPRVFTETRFASGETPAEAVSGTGSSTFASDISSLFAIFNWELLEPGTLWQMRWLVDDNVFYDQTFPWDNAQTGQNYIVRLNSTDVANGIPDGTYRVEILISGVLLAVLEAEVGIGQLPIDPFAQTTGVQMNGRILDSETLEGLPNVTLILLTEEYSVVDFVWSEEQVFALATTDNSGRFQIDRPLEFDVPYSVIVSAEGYLPITQDGVIVDEETPNPLEIELYLTTD